MATSPKAQQHHSPPPQVLDQNASGAEGELQDSVQRTCSGACALRAVELLRSPKDAILRDELALCMSGPRMLRWFGERWDAWEAAEGPGKHSYFAGRARVLDELVQEAAAALAARTGDHASAPPGAPVDEASGGGGSGVGGSGGSGDLCVQVVSLGCGMDTRPWRLGGLPGGTAWFDVDQAPVIELKDRFLREAGAELGPSAAASGGGRGGSQQGAEAGEAFTLKCSSYRQVVSDLSQPGLQQQLEAAGFDPALPTLWVLEGLCYYLPLDANARLLADAAAASPPGSRLLATHIPRENLDANRACQPGVSALGGLFTVCIDDVQADGMLGRAGWGDVVVSGDIGEEVMSRFGVESYYPYSLEYSGGRRLGGIEVILEAVRQ